MADLIQCPVCGENNPADLEFCQFCQSRLQPLTGALKGADAPIKPGQMPTKKTTAELEPILPQWLRDARDSARQSTDAEAPAPAAPVEETRPEPPPAPPVDLLAGFHAQQDGEDEEEEAPDWLVNITGGDRSKKDKEPPSEVRWVELGSADDFLQDEPEPQAPVEQQADPNDWFKTASANQVSFQPVTAFPEPAASSAPDETPDWLRSMAADAAAGQFGTQPEAEPASTDSQDWLRNLSTAAESQQPAPQEEPAEEAPTAAFDEEPDWLRAMGGSQASAPAQAPAGDDLPSWMQPSTPAPTEFPASSNDEIPQWLRDEPIQPTGMPVWFSEAQDADSSSKDKNKKSPLEENVSFGDIPEWLKAAAPQSTILPAAEEEPPAAPALAFGDQQAAATPAFHADAVDENLASAFAGLPATDIDSLFSEMPDWLSSSGEPAAPAPSAAPFVGMDEEIMPTELPSWIEAMRPVMPGGMGAPGDQTLESRGALAGLQGVLPAVAGFTASSKPKAYSNKLQASEEQQSHAVLLEKLLAAENEPVPLSSLSSLKPSRSLRWALTALFVLVLFPVIFLRTQIFSMPVGAPREVNAALDVAQSIPAGSPVLVVFDFEPARAAEMESAAAPLFALFKEPNLTFISTNETGGLLAERFAAGHLPGASIHNLGYLPGGQMGIRAFAQDPDATAPLDAFLNPAWTQPGTLQQHFIAMVIVTDSASSARSWVEQTTDARAGMPVLVVSSAQAAPMIQPYFDAGQIRGLVAGLYGGAIVEQYAGISGGSARMVWDAYSIGMLLATLLVIGGLVWGGIARMREKGAE